MNPLGETGALAEVLYYDYVCEVIDNTMLMLQNF